MFDNHWDKTAIEKIVFAFLGSSWSSPQKERYTKIVFECYKIQYEQTKNKLRSLDNPQDPAPLNHELSTNIFRLSNEYISDFGWVFKKTTSPIRGAEYLGIGFGYLMAGIEYGVASNNFHRVTSRADEWMNAIVKSLTDANIKISKEFIRPKIKQIGERHPELGIHQKTTIDEIAAYFS